jgi:hypothetical protein
MRMFSLTGASAAAMVIGATGCCCARSHFAAISSGEPTPIAAAYTRGEAPTMPTATDVSKRLPRESVRFSNNQPVRCAASGPRNCQRTRGITSVSLLVTRVTRRSRPRRSSSTR